MGIETYIIHYGYIVILLGTFFECETLLVLAGFLAHRGYLVFSLVVLFAVAGTFAGDQFYFFIGRKKGMAYLDTHQSWKVKSGRVLKLMQQHQTLVILLLRNELKYLKRNTWIPIIDKHRLNIFKECYRICPDSMIMSPCELNRNILMTIKHFTQTTKRGLLFHLSFKIYGTRRSEVKT